MASFFDDNAIFIMEMEGSEGDADVARLGLKSLLERAGFEIDTLDGKPYARGEKKFEQGGPKEIQTFLGILFDLTDLEKPTASLPEDKLALPLRVLLPTKSVSTGC